MCRSDRRKAVEEMEVIQTRCNQAMDDMKQDTQKQIEYAKREYEDTIKSIREEADERVRKVEENAVHEARATALDQVEEAQSETAKAEAEVQDLRRELEKLTEDRSQTLDQLKHVSARTEREKYVLHERIEFMDQQYQERMQQQESIMRTEMQTVHEKQIKQVLKELEWEKQKLILYRTAAENEMQDTREALAQIVSIHEETSVHFGEMSRSLEEFRGDILERQRHLEEEVRVVSEEALGFMSTMLRPASPNLDAANVQTLHKKVQKLKASFAYLKFRSMMGVEKKQNDENSGFHGTSPQRESKSDQNAGRPSTPQESGPLTTPQQPAEPKSNGRRPAALARGASEAPEPSPAPTPPERPLSKAASDVGRFSLVSSPYRTTAQNKATFVQSNTHQRAQSARSALRYSGADISTLKPSSASFTPNFAHLKPLAKKSQSSVKDVTNLGPLLALQSGTADFRLKDFEKPLERKRSGRSTLV